MERDANPSRRGGEGEGRRGGYATSRNRGKASFNSRGGLPDRQNVDGRISDGTGVSSFDEHMSGKGSFKSDAPRQVASRGERTPNSMRGASWKNLGNGFSNHSSSTSIRAGSFHNDHPSLKSRNSMNSMDGLPDHSDFSSHEDYPELENHMCSLALADERSVQRSMAEVNHLASANSSIGKEPYPGGGMGHEQAEIVNISSQSGTQGSTECPVNADQFDICRPIVGSAFKLKPSLFETNREKRKEMKQALEGRKDIVLRDGMILLKNYISVSEQVKIIKECQRLGLGPGGFYQPGYRDGAKLHLKMMCLGKNWDPETSMYTELRPTDGARPPAIPKEFFQLVKKSVEDSHALIAKECGTQKVEKRLPLMVPDICIVNFYTASGRLGLHQDRDESKESLLNGLPVVSISIGDSAEFLFGDERDIDKAEKVVLASGDVLIFGGKSRHVYHGVSSILPNTAPKSLLEETNLRPGRLNLTFREY